MGLQILYPSSLQTVYSPSRSSVTVPASSWARRISSFLMARGRLCHKLHRGICLSHRLGSRRRWPAPRQRQQRRALVLPNGLPNRRVRAPVPQSALSWDVKDYTCVSVTCGLVCRTWCNLSQSLRGPTFLTEPPVYLAPATFVHSVVML